MSKTLREQIKSIRPTVLNNGQLPVNSSEWKADGVDHINIAGNASTELGRFLSIRNSTVFDNPVLGDFRSINNAWHFVRARNSLDQIRHIGDAARLRDFVSKNGGELPHIQNFNVLLMHIAYLRLLNSPRLMKAMIDSTLPFDTYRIIATSGIRQRFAYANWFVAGYAEIRKALVERREPNFGPLFDTRRDAEAGLIYIDLLNRINGEKKHTSDPDLKDWIADKWSNFDAKMNKPEKSVVDVKSFTVMSIDTPVAATPVEKESPEAISPVAVETVDEAPVIEEDRGDDAPEDNAEIVTTIHYPEGELTVTSGEVSIIS